MRRKRRVFFRQLRILQNLRVNKASTASSVSPGKSVLVERYLCSVHSRNVDDCLRAEIDQRNLFKLRLQTCVRLDLDWVFLSKKSSNRKVSFDSFAGGSHNDSNKAEDPETDGNDLSDNYRPTQNLNGRVVTGFYDISELVLLNENVFVFV